jgi:RNA polymerase sigma-70 factor (ECF subfamily)
MAEEQHLSGDGDDDFHGLYVAHLPAVIAFFRRRGFTTSEARDLAQDTFVRAFNGWDKFRHESSFKTWVLRIAANVWRNELRARGAQKRDAPPMSSFDETMEAALGAASTRYGDNGTNGPYDIVWTRQRRELMHRALRELPPQMQRCLLLHVSGDFKYREIADVMNISIGAVKSQLHEARERLKTRLGRFLDGPGA